MGGNNETDKRKTRKAKQTTNKQQTNRQTKQGGRGKKAALVLESLSVVRTDCDLQTTDNKLTVAPEITFYTDGDMPDI